MIVNIADITNVVISKNNNPLLAYIHLFGLLLLTKKIFCCKKPIGNGIDKYKLSLFKRKYGKMSMTAALKVLIITFLINNIIVFVIMLKYINPQIFITLPQIKASNKEIL